MATYIAPCSFTDQGVKTVKDSPKRAEAVKALAKKFGCEMTQLCWTLGQYDLISIMEASDDKAATAFGLAVGAQGNVRTQTLRAFSGKEIGEIIGKLGECLTCPTPTRAAASPSPNSSASRSRPSWHSNNADFPGRPTPAAN